MSEMINFQVLTLILTILFITACNSQHAEVRLSSGWHGRVEVKQVGETSFGLVCHDYWDDQDCRVVCRQLGYSGGTRAPNAYQTYGQGTGTFVLDDVACNGDENYLDECMHDFWGLHNCVPTDVAGCVCSTTGNTPPPPTIPTTTHAPPPPNPGYCNSNLHRLVEFDSVRFPGVGRVEVRLSTSSPWSSICDDQWSDIGAKVFCNCVGYTNTAQSHAFWNPNLSTLSSVPMLYDSVQCSASHVTQRSNLHDCTVLAAAGRCGSSEQAAVACSALPHTGAPPQPSVNLVCNDRTLQICFTSNAYSLSKQYLSLSGQTCSYASTRDISGGVCMDVDMNHCPAVESTTNSAKKYCYDISYSQYDSDPQTLLIDQVWTRNACCEVDKNGTVTGSFQPIVINHNPVQTRAPTSFVLECFPDDTFGGTPLTMPAALVRGQDVYCRVSSLTWDPDMYLVVPSCKFMATAYGTPEYTFHHNKCPTSSNLNVNYFHFDGHKWGFKFPLPKFQGFTEVYLQCDAYICDPQHDAKPYCDRSCQQMAVIGRRRRRSVDDGSQNMPHPTSKIVIRSGPFHVQDNGFGPLISSNGRMTIVLPPDSYNSSSALSNAKAKSKISQSLQKLHSVMSGDHGSLHSIQSKVFKPEKHRDYNSTTSSPAAVPTSSSGYCALFALIAVLTSQMWW